MKTMKVSKIVNIMNEYKFMFNKIQRDKTALNWELMNTGETEKTLRLRKQIALDEEALGKFLDEEI